MGEKSNMKLIAVIIITTLVVGLSAVLFIHYTKEKRVGVGKARFYYLITDNEELNYSLENSEGLVVTQLADDSIRVVQPDGRAYMFRNDIMLETADISPFKIMEAIVEHTGKGELEGAVAEVLHDGSERLKVEIQGVKEISDFYNLISPTYSKTQSSILNNMLKVRRADSAILEFDMVTNSGEMVYMLVNYQIDSSVFNIWRVEGQYVKEIADWSLGFDWPNIDVTGISDVEISNYLDRLVQVVNGVIESNFGIRQPTIKED